MFQYNKSSEYQAFPDTQVSQAPYLAEGLDQPLQTTLLYKFNIYLDLMSAVMAETELLQLSITY